MDITSTFTNRRGELVTVTYSEGDPYKNLEGRVLFAVHAFCFCNDKLVLVNHPKSGWMPPGGGIEPGETITEATAREVLEETNMNVIHQEVIGYQDVTEADGRILRQIRSLCIVEPHGPFVADPDGEIMEIQLVDPSTYKQYFNWHEIGDRVMQRALELKQQYDLSQQSI
jgi:ADP-ribose pyrophosphatase YjhB (NUDIX family)